MTAIDGAGIERKVLGFSLVRNIAIVIFIYGHAVAAAAISYRTKVHPIPPRKGKGKAL
jgi:hypothetical protein